MTPDLTLETRGGFAGGGFAVLELTLSSSDVETTADACEVDALGTSLEDADDDLPVTPFNAE